MKRADYTLIKSLLSSLESGESISIPNQPLSSIDTCIASLRRADLAKTGNWHLKFIRKGNIVTRIK